MLESRFVNSGSPIRFRSVGEASVQISWWKVFFAVVIMGTTLLTGLGVLGLTGPDEPRYAAIAREMVRTGDWVTPRLYGHPWFEKPILYYWAAASSYRIFGVTEFAARLPDALAALLATLLAVWAALRAYGIRAAWLVALMLPVTVAMPVFGRAATTDMLFSTLLMGAAVAAAEMLAKPRAGRLARVAFGAFLGGAVLAKGPAGVVLAGGAIFLWAVASRQWRAALRFVNFASVAAFCVVALPWYALAATRNPEFLRIFLWQQNVQRYLTPIFLHPQPFWFFGAILLGLVMPWTFLLVPLLSDAWHAMAEGGSRNSAGLFFACWVIFPVLFFSFSRSKLPSYVLPSVPPLILLLAASAATRMATNEKGYRFWAALAAGMLVLVPLAGLYWLHRQTILPDIPEMGAARTLLLVAIAGGILCLSLTLRSAYAGIAAMAGWIAILVVTTNLVLLPKLDPLVSPRALAASVPEQMRKSADVYDYYANLDWIYGLEFYMDRDFSEWSLTAPLPYWEWTTARIAAVHLTESPRWRVVMRPPTGPWLLQLK